MPWFTLPKILDKFIQVVFRLFSSSMKHTYQEPKESALELRILITSVTFGILI